MKKKWQFVHRRRLSGFQCHGPRCDTGDRRHSGILPLNVAPSRSSHFSRIMSYIFRETPRPASVRLRTGPPVATRALLARVALHDEYVKVDGLWKFKSRRVDMFYFTPISEGWAKADGLGNWRSGKNPENSTTELNIVAEDASEKGRGSLVRVTVRREATDEALDNRDGVRLGHRSCERSCRCVCGPPRDRRNF